MASKSLKSAATETQGTENAMCAEPALYSQTYGNAAIQEEMAAGRAGDEVSESASTLGSSHLYAHGGYMAAVDDLLANAVWSGILDDLSPNASEIRGGKDIGDRMSAAENDPVVAAYGHWLSDQTGRAVPIEWDVWLDKDQPADLTKATIAHGTLTQLALGITPDGQAADSWMRLFGLALQAADGGAGFSGPLTAEGLAGQVGAELNEAGGVVLDIKSKDSSAEDVASFVSTLESSGLQVAAVGSFTASQLLAVDAEKRLRFFFKVDELLDHEDYLSRGERVMINLGDLLTSESEVDWAKVATLAGVAGAWDLQVGGYVQETALSPEAHETLVVLVTARDDLFTLGYAYGNVDGRAAQADGDGFRAADAAGAEAQWDDSLDQADSVSGLATRLGLAKTILLEKGVSFQLAQDAKQDSLGMDGLAPEVGRLAHEHGILDAADPQDQRLYETVNRAEAATMVCRAFGIETLDSGRIVRTFPDLPADHWAAPTVYGPVRVGVITGIDGYFKPSEPIAYEHVAPFVAKAAAGSGSPVSFDPTVRHGVDEIGTNLA